VSDNLESEKSVRKIVIMKNGSYHVFGLTSLVHKTQIVSEYGEPITWNKDEVLEPKNAEGRDFYGLCRCGGSCNKPYCDGTHREIGFDGTETADTHSTQRRMVQFRGGTHIVVSKDPSLCMSSGFCGFHDAGINELVGDSSDTKIRALVMAMVANCPSGSLTYRIEADDADIEPDLPEQIALTAEITSEGPITGPIWVTGNIPIERADGKPFEPRNRVTLCNCGQSANKPLCDGAHRFQQEQALRKKRAEK
jgi:CDGSH-type Zn-finger protein